MADELSYKTLLTFALPVATYVGGLFTEPAKKWLSTRTDRKRLRNALYSELAGNLNHLLPYLSSIAPHAPMPYPIISQWLRLDVYQDALIKQPVLFNEIRESKAIAHIYLFFNALKDMPEAERFSRLKALTHWITQIITRKLLSRRLLKRHQVVLSPSLFDLRHPIIVRMARFSDQLAHRNFQPQGRCTFMPPTRLGQKLRALYKGIPGDPIELPEELTQEMSRRKQYEAILLSDQQPESSKPESKC
jgi:hypothetical protein